LLVVLPSLLGVSAPPPAISIPVWDQYVALLTWALDGLAGIFNSGGLAIIAFTIIIKTIILPLTVQSIRSSKAMQELQPKIKELQKKHGKDRQRLSTETMALYQQHRVNPMAGCLPMLLQIPIFLGLYNAILGLSNQGSGVWNNAFLWIPDLSQPDPIHILPIMAAAFQFVQTKMMRPANQGKITDPQQAMMNSVMNIMPLTVILFGWSFAAGPVIYWATQSVYSVVQQWFITGWGSLRDWLPSLWELPEHRRLGYRAPRDPADLVVVGGEGGQVVRAGVGGWFQKKMEEAQQQAMARSAPAETADDEPSEVEADGAKRAVVIPAARNGTGTGPRTGSKTGPKSSVKGGANGRARGGAGGGAARATAPAEASNGAASGKAVIVPRKAKPPAT
jgi:YidC/Oxa1 family membrane protein insertase